MKGGVSILLSTLPHKKKRPALPADLVLLVLSAFRCGPCVSFVNFEPHLNLGDKEVLFKMICCVPLHSRKLNSCFISESTFEIPARTDRHRPQASFPQGVRNNTLCARRWITCTALQTYWFVNAGSSRSDGSASMNSRSHVLPPGSLCFVNPSSHS